MERGSSEQVVVTALRRIVGQPREYAWGSTRAIHDLLGSAPTGGPLAEMWFGAHPSAPAMLTGGPHDHLDDLITAEPAESLGAAVRQRFGDQLPYLLKIIAPAEPLSMQTHPSLERARQRFAAEDAAGIPLDHATRGYSDPNHKPELFYALQRSEVLAGFRDLTDTRAVLSRISAPLARDLAASLGDDDLHTTLAALLDPATGPAPAELDELVAACTNLVAQGSGPTPGGERADEAVRAAETVVTLAEHYPHDPATAASLLLNPVTLEPGQALYVPTGTMHAHLRGLGVEIMAASDNVLRAGLTPKHIDVAETLASVEFVTGPPQLVTPQRDGSSVVFGVPVPDFGLAVTTIDRPDGAVGLPGNGPRVLLSLAGDVVVAAGGERLRLRRGDAAFVPAEAGAVSLSGEGRLVQADVPAIVSD